MNAEIELGRPENLSQLEAVKIFEDVLKKKMDVQHIPIEALTAQLNSAEDVMQKSFTGLMICVAKGDFIDMKAVLNRFPVELTSVKDFAHSLVQA